MNWYDEYMKYISSPEGKKETQEKYGNMFTDNLFYLYGYYFNDMYGQGRIIQITKKEE